MRGEDIPLGTLCRYLGLDERIPKTYLLRHMRLLVDGVLCSMSVAFDAKYSRLARPSVPPEKLLLDSLLQVLNTHSKRAELGIL